MTKEKFLEIVVWQNSTFPNSTIFSKLAHLKQELKEVEIDILTDNPDVKLEFADCYILLFGCVSAANIDFDLFMNESGVAIQGLSMDESTPIDLLHKCEGVITELLEQRAINGNHLCCLAYINACLFSAAVLSGIMHNDLNDAIDAKMVINRKRRWGKPDANGIVNHISDDPSVNAVNEYLSDKHNRDGEV